ncbi:MAG: ribonuclease E/G, partial [Alphaproteobacteria bacterium]|nr:ribonuclease E/G [Alphaproteobacteria bacterium]
MDILIEELSSNLWAAALNKGRLEGLEIDPVNEEVRWGSIYYAKVKRIDAALDAAFLDLDGENTGILYNRDIRTRDKDGKMTKGGTQAIGKTLTPGDMVTVQAKSAYLYQSHSALENNENKTAQMSMDITLPGRYLIFCPMGNDNRLSGRIKGKPLRNRLEKMIDAIKDMHGFILRASAADTQTDILRREARILKEMWEAVSRYFEGSAPALIMAGPDSIQRILSDNAAKSIERIEVVTMDHYTQVEDWCAVYAPDLVPKITPVEIQGGEQDLALFEYRDIIDQIEALFQDYVILPGGGNLIIQDTAALLAIDINRGGDKRSNLAVNIEAAAELSRQIRLRNAGGIIAVDFLKMQDKSDEKALLEALEKSVNEDPCTVQIHG